MRENKYTEAENLIPEISKFWSILSEEDRDFIHGCRYAIEMKIEWKQPTDDL